MYLRQTKQPVTENFDMYVNHFLKAENNHIFNDQKFFNMHATRQNDSYMQLVRNSDSRVFATIAFYDDAQGNFSSPLRGTFGGLSLNSQTNIANIEKFFQISLSYLKLNGGRRFTIKCPPTSHDPALFAIFFNIMLRNGFKVSAQELSYDVNVTDNAFIDRLEYGKARRIKKCIQEGFHAEKLAPAKYKEAYEIISSNRIRRGFPITMTYQQLEDLCETFPERIHFFAVYSAHENGDMIAASVCIEITNKIFYVFYWGDIAGVEAYSPVVFLVSFIYDYCQRNNFRILDVGASTVEGQPNYGLIKFKRDLGFQESLKASFKYSEMHSPETAADSTNMLS